MADDRRIGIKTKSTDCNVHDPWRTLINQYLVPDKMCGKKYIVWKMDPSEIERTYTIERQQNRFKNVPRRCIFRGSFMLFLSCFVMLSCASVN